MSEHRPALEHIQAYADHLRLEEKSAATVEKYLRDVRAFARWLEGREITKERTAAWKTHLVERGYAPRQRQCHALRPEQSAGLSRLRGLPGEVSQGPAADVPE